MLGGAIAVSFTGSSEKISLAPEGLGNSGPRGDTGDSMMASAARDPAITAILVLLAAMIISLVFRYKSTCQEKKKKEMEEISSRHQDRLVVFLAFLVFVFVLLFVVVLFLFVIFLFVVFVIFCLKE